MKILVIEDNPTNMKLITGILKKSDHEVLQASDAPKGIEIAREQSPAIILMDIQMPGMDGLAATKLLKNDPKTGHIKIIAVTALAMKGDKERILEAGCDGYISKPVNYKEVLDVVNSFEMEQSTHTVLIVDDEEKNVKLLEAFCSKLGHATLVAKNGKEGVERALHHLPDLILMDIMMPEMDGFEATERLKSDERTQNIPVIIITALESRQDLLNAISKGANDFLYKPVDYRELTLRIKNNLKVKEFHDHLKSYSENLEKRVAERTQELVDALNKLDRSYHKIKSGYVDTIHRLGIIAEYKDEDTGEHIHRISLYTRELALSLGLDLDYAETITHASTMHDIGKVSIPDDILFKPGKLDEQEWKIMKTHPEIGAEVLKGSDSEYLKMATNISIAHHERWDGSGYPHGLEGDEIPLEGRIMNIADQYDALRSKRSYKPALDHETAVEIITKGDGRTEPEHFDPQVLDAFKRSSRKLQKYFESFRDTT